MKSTYQLIGALLATASLTFAGGHPKMARDLDQVDPSSMVDVIVQFRQAPTAAHLDRVRQRGGVHTRRLDLVNGGVFRMSAQAAAQLADDPDVTMISPDRQVTATLDRANASTNYNQLANFLDSNQMAKGGGIGIAIIDSGMDLNHPNFKAFASTASRIVYSESFVPSQSATDAYGHGTHVAGIAAGADNLTSLSGNVLSHWFWGFAPDANIINLKVLDGTGTGSDSYVIAAINRAIQLKSTYNIRVINLSLGRAVTTSYKTDPLCQAVEAAWKSGIVVVVAAGNYGRDNSQNNNGYGTITAPGNDPYVITVGAANSKGDTDRSNDVIATYSSKGPTAIDHIAKPDLVAPGNRIVSEQVTGGGYLPNTYPANKPNVQYYFPAAASSPSPYFFTLSGTSMAAPVVSGIVAELLAKSPALTPDQVKARLMRTAWRGFPATMTTYDPATNQTYTGYHDLFTVGAGMVDAWAAYNDTTASTGSAASPSAYYDSAAKKVKLNLNSTSASTVVWGTTLVWGTSLVWGTNVVSDVSSTSVVWGTSLVWGTSTMQGFTVVWGTGGMSGSSTLAGEAAAIAINGEN